MKKTYLLDTNVLIKSPSAIFNFEDNNIIIPEMVLRELDNLKTHQGEVGYGARTAIRNIYKVVSEAEQITNIPMSTGGTLSIIPDYCPDKLPDDVIISDAKKQKAILVTADIAMFLKAKSEYCEAQIYSNENASEETISYNGRNHYYVSAELIDKLYKSGKVPIPKDCFSAYENEYFVLQDTETLSHSVLAKREGEYLVLVTSDVKPKGIVPKNVGQKFALDALLAPVDKVPLVILKGPAGTAKTFLALAAGLHLVENKTFNKILLLRPNVKFDEDIGYLKGDEMDKITPLIRPCLDNLEAIIASSIEGTLYARQMVDRLFAEGIVEAEALAYVRGRSIANSYIIVDEAQNSTPNQILGIVTRAGINSKIIVTGDPDQIDNPKIDKKNNGLTFLADKMLGSSLCAQIGFSADECVRSELAAEAGKRLITR